MTTGTRFCVAARNPDFTGVALVGQFMMALDGTCDV